MANSRKTEKNGRQEFQRLCDEVHMDLEETREYKREKYFKRYEGRARAEITIDLVSQARAKMLENKVNGQKDATVSEMIKQSPQERIASSQTYFQKRIMETVEAPSSRKIVKLVFFAEIRCRAPKRKKLQYASCIIFRRETESWNQLRVREVLMASVVNTLQVVMTQLLQKHWEWQPTMYLAGMDIETAFDVARPKRIAKIVGDHDVHGWMIAALLREIAGLEGQATFENVERTFSFARCIRQ